MNRTSLFAALVATLLSGSAFAQSRANASRVDFDDQLVQGQVNKGAVHLIERKESDFGSLIKKRTSYRKEILAGTAVAEARPVGSMEAAALPVVHRAELEAKAEPTRAEAPAVKRAPAAKSKANVKKQGRAKKTSKKSAKKATNGGSRVVSRR